MTRDDLIAAIVEALAEVRAMSVTSLNEEIGTLGMGAMLVSSHEVVTVLVMLRAQTGIDPTDSNVLKGCNLQSFQSLVEFMGPIAAAEA